MFVQLHTGPAAAAHTWRMYKLGHPVDPMDVVVNGSKSLHAVSDEGVSVDSIDGAQQLTIQYVLCKATIGCCVRTCCRYTPTTQDAGCCSCVPWPPNSVSKYTP